MSKFEDTRIVTFQEDYMAGDPKKVYYKKDSVHAIHYKVVEKIKTNGGKIKVEEFDRKAFINREKEKVRIRRKDTVSIERR